MTRGQGSKEQSDHVGFVGHGKDFETYSKGNGESVRRTQGNEHSNMLEVGGTLPLGYLGALLFPLMCEFGLADAEFGSRTGQACCVSMLP